MNGFIASLERVCPKEKGWPPQHNGAFVGRGRLDFRRIGVSSLSYGDGKLFGKSLQGTEEARIDEIDEGPEFFEVVLHRGAGEDEPVRSGQVLEGQGGLEKG